MKTLGRFATPVFAVAIVSVAAMAPAQQAPSPPSDQSPTDIYGPLFRKTISRVRRTSSLSDRY